MKTFLFLAPLTFLLTLMTFPTTWWMWLLCLIIYPVVSFFVYAGVALLGIFHKLKDGVPFVIKDKKYTFTVSYEKTNG